MIKAMSGSQPYAWAGSAGNALPGGLSLGSIMTLALMERHDIYQNQIRSQIDDMQARNNLLKDMNKALAVLRTNRPTDEKAIKDYGSFVDSQGTTQDVFEWMRQNGIPIAATEDQQKMRFTWWDPSSHMAGPIGPMLIATQNGGKRGVQSQFDAAISNLKAAIDSANSEGQMALIFLQGVLDKLNQVAELMSNLLSKDHKIKEVIIGNCR
ncbi:hypothetical protein [Bradyrhizobium sp. SBR1B]|uniref:hypothetical protein n=1 Tax=Bradyrhizobium sp. SBR1B TaxID=2663836 RepID=UPI001605B97F|nr:hypothetical protein [Bradyrhizobium sp. SBR1B]MBB4383505.1 hypothetical protein [Bradyrhizobium sp. SBR1B]